MEIKKNENDCLQGKPLTMNDYNWFRYTDDAREEWRRTPPINCRTVHVECEGRAVSGVTARICQYFAGGAFSLDIDSHRPAEFLHERATRLLRASGRILPMESVGYPECTETCVSLKRTSDMNLEPRRKMLASIPAAALRMKQKYKRADQETRMLAKWAAETNFPEDLEHYVHQFLRPQSYRTWSQVRI